MANPKKKIKKAPVSRSAPAAAPAPEPEIVPEPEAPETVPTPEPAAPTTPAEPEVPYLEPLVDVDALDLLEPVAPRIPGEAPQPQPQKTPELVRTNDFDEFLIGHGEPVEEPDTELPDIYVLHGVKKAPVVPTQTDGYTTQAVLGGAESNLIWYPTIVCGRCELCGSTRYVGGDVIKQVNRKTGEYRFRYRGGTWVEISAATCKHYRNIAIECSFCREAFTGAKDRLGQFTELLGERVVFVTASPSSPKSLVMVCNDFGCKNKFDEKFNLNDKI